MVKMLKCKICGDDFEYNPFFPKQEWCENCVERNNENPYDYYFCFHEADNTVFQTRSDMATPDAKGLIRCPSCHNPMTYGRYTRKVENGSVSYTPYII